MITSRRVLLADADAFYVSVARLMDPDGVGKEPLVIVGGSATGRGVVTSASYQAREFGVRSAMPTAQALRLCPGAVVVPVPRDLCTQKSREILEVLKRFSPVVEPASIDEFYLDMVGTVHLYDDEPLANTAERIRSTVIDETGLSVSIGGGTSKLIAKLAAKIAKSRPGRDGNGVYIVAAGAEAEFMAELELAAIPMIGPKFQERLQRFGLNTVRDALRHDRITLEQWFGKRTGHWLYQRVRGVDTTTINAGPRRRSIGHEETFARDLTTDEELERELLRLAVHVAGDLRRKRLSARTITVKIKDTDFTVRQASRTLAAPFTTDGVVHAVSRELLHKLRNDRNTPARLLGVSLSQLRSDVRDPAQLSLFVEDSANVDAHDTDRDRTLSEIRDRISEKFGHTGIVRGTEVLSRRARRPHST